MFHSSRVCIEWWSLFPQSTPKYSFLVWIAIRNRLQMGDRMQAWSASIHSTCVLCQKAQKACQHLFFSCKYSSKVWEVLVKGILQDAYTITWSEIIAIISNPSCPPTEAFIIRYAFQATVHSIWRERNSRRHGEQPCDANGLIKFVGKTVIFRWGHNSFFKMYIYKFRIH